MPLDQATLLQLDSTADGKGEKLGMKERWLTASASAEQATTGQTGQSFRRSMSLNSFPPDDSTDNLDSFVFAIDLDERRTKFLIVLKVGPLHLLYCRPAGVAVTVGNPISQRESDREAGCSRLRASFQRDISCQHQLSCVLLQPVFIHVFMKTYILTFNSLHNMALCDRNMHTHYYLPDSRTYVLHIRASFPLPQ